jgi:hypothetical protein
VAKLNKRTVDAAKADPDRRATVLWDSEVKGFGLSISSRALREEVRKLPPQCRGAFPA